MPNYKLYYFNLRARGEITRLIFAASETPYEDIRLKGLPLDWAEEKQAINPPYGQIPVFEVDGVRLCQSMTIARFMARKTGLAGDNPLDEARADMIVECCKDIIDVPIKIYFENDPKKKAEIIRDFDEEKLPRQVKYLEKMLKDNGGQWFVGNKLCWADLAVIDCLQFAEGDKHPVPWSTVPKMAAHKKRVEAIPAVAKYLASRPITML